MEVGEIFEYVPADKPAETLQFGDLQEAAG